MTVILLVGALVLIVIDQLTKYWAATVLKPVGSLPFIPGLIEFRYVENTGAAFSFFRGMQVFLIVVTGIALLVIAYLVFVRKFKDKIESIAFAVILAGGIGNLIDRVLNGYVVDFLSVQLFDFAIFNVADICVVCGFLILAIAYIKQEIARIKDEKKIKEAKEG